MPRRKRIWPSWIWYRLSCGCRFAHGVNVTVPDEVKCPKHRWTAKVVKEGA